MTTQTQILAPGSGAGNSTSVTVDGSASVKLALKAFDNLAVARIEEADDAGNWQDSGHSLTATRPSVLIVAPGQYRVVRLDGTCGAFKSE